MLRKKQQKINKILKIKKQQQKNNNNGMNFGSKEIQKIGNLAHVAYLL